MFQHGCIPLCRRFIALHISIARLSSVAALRVRSKCCSLADRDDGLFQPLLERRDRSRFWSQVFRKLPEFLIGKRCSRWCSHARSGGPCGVTFYSPRMAATCIYSHLVASKTGWLHRTVNPGRSKSLCGFESRLGYFGSLQKPSHSLGFSHWGSANSPNSLAFLAHHRINRPVQPPHL
jgi:hypothetical protein